MAKTLIPAPDVKEIVIKLVERYPTNLENVDVERILFWYDISPRKKKALAYVKKVDEMDKMVNPNYDYHFVLNTVNIEKLSPAQINILCLHEALHIGPVKIDVNGTETLTTIDHDVKEFYAVIATFGIDWQINPTVNDPLGSNITDLSKKPVPEGEEDQSTDNDVEEVNFV